MMLNKRVVVVLLLGIFIWHIGGTRVGRLRELVDMCVMAELISRTYRHKKNEA
jgi:hypothetical protein